MQVRELVVLCHLRWTWAWQRPHHLAGRLADGRELWFVEPPRRSPDVDAPRLGTEVDGQVTRVWLDVPGAGGAVAYDDDAAADYARLLAEHLGPPEDRAVWLYTPTALDLADALRPDVLVYDVVDGAQMADEARNRRALDEADLVFTAGRELHAAVVERRPERTFLFASGVEPEHFTLARQKRRPVRRPVAGFLGVIDDRVDLDLVRDLAHELPEWDVRLVGPVAGLDPAELPEAPNLSYAGPKPYDELPQVLSGFDVALLPYARARARTSPAETLEYLAAGLPVVSTRVPDVVADYANLVDLQDDAAGFAEACARVKEDDASRRERKARPVLHWHHWDTIAARMERHLLEVTASRSGIAG